MNLHKLRVFCEVVERQSLSLAAQHLIVTPPVVSAHVRDLEAFFGAKLLHQQGRRMALTEAGEVVYRYALEVLRATEEAASGVLALKAGEFGRVVVGANMAPGTYLLPPLLSAFKLRRPGADISLLIADTVTVCEQMHKGTYDFAVLAVPEPPPGLHAELLCQEPLVLFASPSHPRAGQDRVQVESLVDEAFVCSPVSNSRRRVIDARLRERGLASRRLVMTLGHPEAIKQAVRDGVGIALLFRSSIERELRTGELAEIGLEGPDLVHPVYLIHNLRKRFSPVQEQVLEVIRVAQQPADQRLPDGEPAT